MIDTKPLANSLLRVIKARGAEIDQIEAHVVEEIEAIKARHAHRLQELEDILKAADKELIQIMKKNRAVLFEGEDKVILEAGILLYGKEDKVSIPRDALAKLEHYGYTEAIKIAKSVDRGVVEGWPDERLFMIGALRKPVETFSYELKDAEGKGQSA